MPKSNNNNPVAIQQLALLDKLRKAGRFTHPRIESAFQQVPRHLFLPGVPIEKAYADEAVPIKTDPSGLVISSSSQPTMMAIMFDQLGLQPGDNVLEIGTATGYNAALMREMVGEDGRITSIELDHDLAEQARKNLQTALVSGVQVVQADGILGYAPRAAYDAIVVTAGIWDIPLTWKRQLKQEGRIVAPIWLNGVQVSARFDLQPDGTFLSTDNRPCAFVYLRGEAAGPDMRRRVGSTSLYLISDGTSKLDTVALHTLLSEDHEYCLLDNHIQEADFWYGFQLYVMLHEPKDMVFALFAVIEGQQAYGMEGRGLALLAPSSAVFLPYNTRGQAHCFAGADALFEMQTLLDTWMSLGRPETQQLRVRLIPKNQGKPKIERGKIYPRRDHYLHVWMDTDA